MSTEQTKDFFEPRKAILEPIVGVMSGEGGGVPFVVLAGHIENWLALSEAGDDNAKRMIEAWCLVSATCTRVLSTK